MSVRYIRKLNRGHFKMGHVPVNAKKIAQDTTGDVGTGPADAQANVFTGRNTGWSTGQILVGNFFLGLQSSGYWVFTDHGIPKGAKINSAIVRMTPNGNRISLPTHMATFGSMRRDGRWTEASRAGWSRFVFADFDCVVRDTAVVSQIDTNAGGTATAALPLKDVVTPARRVNLDQRITNTTGAAFTLGSILVRGNRTAVAPGGSVFLDILDNNAAGDEPFEPNSPGSTVLATSNPVLASAFPAAVGNVTFTFSGANQISIPDTAIRHIRMRSTYTANGVNFVNWYYVNSFGGVAYPDGEGWVNGTGTILDDQDYPGGADLVIQTTNTRNVAADVLWSPVPAFFTGVPVDSVDISDVVQDNINQAGYSDGDPIGVLLLGQFGTTGNRPIRAFENAFPSPAELIVNYSA